MTCDSCGLLDSPMPTLSLCMSLLRVVLCACCRPAPSTRESPHPTPSPGRPALQRYAPGCARVGIPCCLHSYAAPVSSPTLPPPSLPPPSPSPPAALLSHPADASASCLGGAPARCRCAPPPNHPSRCLPRSAPNAPSLILAALRRDRSAAQQCDFEHGAP